LILFFALQIDCHGKLSPAIDVAAFCNRWEISEGDLSKALGELRKKGIIVSILSRLHPQLLRIFYKEAILSRTFYR
jgi:hypothetical protein